MLLNRVYCQYNSMITFKNALYLVNDLLIKT